MIEAFRAAIIHRGISAGADALGISQSSMTRDLAELQRLVGYALFVKHGRTVKPTDEALALMTKVQQSFLGLEDIARFSDQLRKQRMSRLSIGAIPALGHSVMPDAIAFLRRSHPNLVITLELDSSIDVAQKVRERQVDIGFSAQGFAVREVEAVAEFSSDCVCVAAAGALPADWTQVEMQQLTGRPFIASRGTLQKRLDVMLRSIGGELDVVAEVSHSLSASELALRGLGIAVVDAFTGTKHRAQGGITLPLRPALPFTVQALAMGDMRLSAPTSELLRFLESATHSATGGF